MVDAENRHHAERAAAESAPRLQEAAWTVLQSHFHTSPLALVLLDGAYRVQHCSRRAEALFGRTEAEMQGLALLKASTPLLHEADRGAVADTLRRWDLRAPDGLRFRTRVRPRESDERVTVWHCSAVVDDEGQATAITALVEDMTEQVERENALREAKEQAEAMDQLKSSFLTSMSHEIRTPLTSIVGFAEVLMEELPDQYQEFAGLILTAARRLLGTLNSVLDLAKLESHRLLHTDDFDLTAAVRETLAIFQPRASSRGLALSLEAPPEPVQISLDPEAVQRVLTNLVSNALKFTREGEVRVRIKEEDDGVLLQVRDTGIGISEAFLPSLFEEFQQEPEAQTHVGSGLGLSITRRLVELMGGTIDVESRKGEGSMFTVRLPRRIEASEAP